MMRVKHKNANILKNNYKIVGDALFGINPERLDCMAWRIY
jgi:hypothetical protein